MSGIIVKATLQIRPSDETTRVLTADQREAAPSVVLAPANLVQA